jgi:hypothetical protein
MVETFTGRSREKEKGEAIDFSSGKVRGKMSTVFCRVE